MAEHSEGMTKWKRKRALQDAAARARSAKQAKSDQGTSTSETGPELESSTVDAPGPSGTLPSENTGSESESEKESESENERGSDDSSSDEEEFTDERAQESFDKFVVSLPSVQRKTLAVLLMHSFATRQKMKMTDAAREAGSITGFNERTVRKYRKDYFENKGKFPETRFAFFLVVC